MKKWIGIYWTILSLCLVGNAQELPGATIDLDNCFKQALKNNLDLGIAEELPVMADADVGLARSSTDPYITSSFGFRRGDTRFGDEREGAFNFGVHQRVPTGTQLSLLYSMEYAKNYDFEFYRDLNATARFFFDEPIDDDFEIKRLYSSGVTMRVSQALLRNFGFTDFGLAANTSEHRAAKKARRAADYEIQKQINGLLFSVEIAYWTWVFMLENKEALSKSIEEVEQLKKKVEKARSAGLEKHHLHLMEVSLSSRKDFWISADKECQLAQDQLKRLILRFDTQEFGRVNWSDAAERESFRTALQEAEKIAERVGGESAVERSYQTALQHRPEIQQANLNLEAREIMIQRNENLLLPELNVYGAYTLLGQTEGGWTAFQKGFNGDHSRWEVGVGFEMPIGNVAARNTLKKSQAEVKQAQVTLQQIKYDVYLEIRKAHREVLTALDRYRESVVQLAAAENLLRELKRSYESMGDLSRLFEIEDAERRRTEAKTLQNQAILAYYLAMANFKRAEAQSYLDYTQTKTDNSRWQKAFAKEIE